MIVGLEIPAVQGSFPVFPCKSISMPAAPVVTGPQCHLRWEVASGADGVAPLGKCLFPGGYFAVVAG